MTEATEQKYDIHNTKEVLKLGFAIPKILKQAKENDGKVDINDIALAMQLIPLVGPAVEDLSLVPKELGELSQSEAQELMAFAAAEVGGVFTDAELIVKINKALVAAVAIYDLVKEF